MINTSNPSTVRFNSSLNDEARIAVSRLINGKKVVLKIKSEEQADILYHLIADILHHLLIKQTEKTEIKPEDKESMAVK